MDDRCGGWRIAGRRVFFSLCFSAAFLIRLLPGMAAHASLPAPVLLPGYPMLAGNVAILIWKPTPGASSYRVYCNDDLAQTAEGVQAMVVLPRPSGDYSFRISAMDSLGEEGAVSAPVLLKVKAIEAPGKVAGFPAADRLAVDLVWGGVPGALQYQAYRGVDGGPLLQYGTSQTTSFRDNGVQVERVYRYSVTALDRNGREGLPSQEVAVTLKEVPARPSLVQRLTKRKDQIRLLHVRETMSLSQLAEWPVSGLTHLQVGPDDLIWVVLPGPCLLLGLGESGRPIRQIGPETFERLNRFTPHRMDFGPNGEFYITDIRRGVLLRLDPRGNVVWRRHASPPPVEDKRAWLGFPERCVNLEPRPSSVLCRTGDILVSDQRLQVLYRFGYDGAPAPCVTHYARGTTEWRFGRIGEIEDLGQDRTLITLPLQRRAFALDSQSRVVLDLESQEENGATLFLGLHGVRRTPDDLLLLTDPALGTVLGIDAATGRYMYHLGKEDEPEPLKMDRPRLADRDKQGRFWVFVGGENRISVFSPVSKVAKAR